MNEDPSHPTYALGTPRIRLSIQNKAEVLEGTVWGHGLDWEELVQLGEFILAYDISSGEQIFREGDGGNFMAIVVEGSVSIRKKNSDGEDREIAVVGPGRPLGELAIIDQQPRSASAYALIDTSLFVMTRSAIDRMEEERPQLLLRLARPIARQLSQRLRQTSGALVDFLIKKDNNSSG